MVNILDKDIISIEENGKITPIKEGETSIEITIWNEITKVIPVSIYNIPVTKVIIDDSQQKYVSDNEINVKSELVLSVSIISENVAYPEITWYSNNESVIQIVNNVLQIIGKVRWF